jgi:putative ABC transport system permease protein
MNILTIPLRNSLRKRFRTLLLVLVFGLGVAAVVALNHVSRAVGEGLERKLTAFGANILVKPRAETLSVGYGGFNLGNLMFEVPYLDENEVVGRIRSIGLKDRLSAVAPKLVTSTRIDEIPVGVVGVDWGEELALKSFWAVDGSYPEKAHEVLVGSVAAAAFELAPGSSITIAETPAVVAGVLRPTGGEDDKVILADLHFLQGVSDKPGLINFVEVAALCSGCPIEDIVAQISSNLGGPNISGPAMEVTALRNVVEQRMVSVAFVERLAFALSLVILLIACAMIGLSMLSAVNERKREIGVLRSLGYSRPNVFGIFCFEALLIGLASGALGYAGGVAVSSKIVAMLEIAVGEMPPPELLHLILAALATALLAGLSSAIPAWKASRVEPSEALITL